jgi:hypothetical protein
MRHIREAQQRIPRLCRYLGDDGSRTERLDQLLRATVLGLTPESWHVLAHARWTQPWWDETFNSSLYAHSAEFEALRLILFAADAPYRAADGAEFSRDEELERTPLGRRKAWARQMDVDMLPRLCLDSHVSVIEILLGNPRMTETWVVRMASRRPNRPSVLRAIALKEKWLARKVVKRALVLNPHTPVSIAMWLAPLMDAQLLFETAEMNTLHPGLRLLSRTLLAFRSDHGLDVQAESFES